MAYSVGLDAQKAREKLEEAMQAIGNSVIIIMNQYKGKGEYDDTKHIMLVNSFELLSKEKEILEDSIDLVETVCKLAKKPYESYGQPEDIPMRCAALCVMAEYLSTGISKSPTASFRFAELSIHDASISNLVIMNCCEEVKSACDLEKDAVTRYRWGEMSDNNPGGLIGHTYSVLMAFDEKEGTTYARKFRDEFQDLADTCRRNARTLWKDAQKLIREIEKGTYRDIAGKAEQAAKYVERASILLNESSRVLNNAIIFVEKI